MKNKRKIVNVTNHDQHSKNPKHKTSFFMISENKLKCGWCFKGILSRYKHTWLLNRTPKSYTCPSNTAKVVCFERPILNPLPQTFLLVV